jgi:hypothetical protein
VLRRKLTDFVGGRAEVHFVRAAVTEQQIEEYALPSRPTKRAGNTHARNFEGDSVELDAMPPDLLRSIVRDCIETHIDAHQLAVTLAAEESEREYLLRLADAVAFAGAGAP